MARKVLAPKGDGRPVGMYSAGFRVDGGSLVLVSGQVAIDGEGRLVGEGDLAAQAAQVYRNLAAVLAEAGCTLADVVKFTTYLTRAEDFAAYTRWRRVEYARLFPDGVYPASTGVVVSSLVRPELLIEVEAIAVRSRRATVTRTGRRRRMARRARR